LKLAVLSLEGLRELCSCEIEVRVIEHRAKRVNIMNLKKRMSLAVSAALGLATALSFPVLAQNEQPAYDSDLMIEEVIVTGTRIISEEGFGRTSPVTVVGMDEISSYGLTRVEDILNNLPQIETAENAFVSNGTTGTATIDLRGLGSSRTLVLINGRRMQPGGVSIESADVNQIPTAMIERVEVLTGGASATYGADAVAGVVNFIMRRVDGVEVSAGISGYQHNNRNAFMQDLMDQRGFTYPTGNSGLDGKAYNIDIVFGGEFADNRGNATVFATWRKNDALLQGARDYSSCALNQPGDWCSGSYNADVPNYDIYPIDEEGNFVFDYDDSFFTLQPDSSLAPWNGNVYNYGPVNFFQRPDERWSAGVFADYEINEHAVTFLEVLLANDETRGQIAESGTFFYEAYPLPISNELFPDNFVSSLEEYFPGEDRFGVYIGKRNTEGGPRSDILSHNSFRIVAGVRGVISDDWDYDVSYLHGQTNSSSTYINDFLATSLYPAVNAELCAATAGCVPYEVFTYQGVTHEQADTLSGTANAQNVSSTDVFNAYATGAIPWGLPAGDVLVVAGYEWRQVEYITEADTLYQEGLLLGQGGSLPNIDGGYRVNELFTEANIPLLADRSWARMMVLDLAYRWSDYSTSGPSSTYRIGLDWQALDSLRIRTGYNRAVRVPNVTELYTPQTIGWSFGIDPCASESPAYSFEQCARSGVTAEQYGRIAASPLNEINALVGGNPNLEPEKADTFTFGLVIEPMNTMQASFDYWDIRIKEAIGSVYPERALYQCVDFGNLCERIHRGVGGTLWVGRTGWVDANYLNLSDLHWRGIDVAWAWSPGNHWNFNLIGTYMLKKETTEIPNDPDSSFDCAGVISWDCWPSPRWRHTATATYDSNSFWALTGRWRYYGKVKYEGTEDLIANDNLGAQNYIDLNAVFRFMETHDVVVGVNNVFDKEPPLMGSSLSWDANTVPGFWDTLGRYAFVNVTLRW